MDLKTEMSIPVKQIKSIDDKHILSMVPRDVLAMLGDNEGSGYDLDKDRRDIFFERGVVNINPTARPFTYELIEPPLEPAEDPSSDEFWELLEERERRALIRRDEDYDRY